MNIKRTEHFIEYQSGDNNGEFIIRVQKDCSQLQMETADSDAFVDVNLKELTDIRDCLTEAIEIKSKHLV